MEKFYGDEPKKDDKGEVVEPDLCAPQEEIERVLRYRATKGAFKVAWLHHQRRNKHHWEYWLQHKSDAQGGSLAMEMPWDEVLEMLCDWHGAGKAKGLEASWEDTYAWFENNGGKMHLHPTTRKRVGVLLWNLKTHSEMF